MLAVFRPLRKKSGNTVQMIRIRQEFHAELQNQLDSVKEVRAYGVEQEHAALYEKISVSFKTAQMQYVRQSTVPGVVYNIAAALLIEVLYLVSTLGLRVKTDRLVVLVYLFARLWPFSQVFRGASKESTVVCPLREVE